ncbi:DNA polymerase II [Candidatus Woesearchaeota archaeon]|nr:DNA polymerase II [Candidatus Woesearchaeota archaeon]
MKGFIVYHTYRIFNTAAKVYLFGRLKNGDSFLSIHDFRPYFYIKKTDLVKAKKLVNFESEDVKLKDFDENNVVKLIFNIPKQIPEARKTFEENSIVCYEADIRFTMRFLMDHGILGSLDIEGEYKKGGFVNRIYENPKIKLSDWVPKLKVMSIDIETSTDLKKLYSLSIVCDDFQKVIILSNKKLKNAISVGSEKEIIENFKDIVKKLDPDVIVGWNLIDFDLKILREKFRLYKIPFVLGRALWECGIRVESSYFKDSTADFPGRQVLDGIHLLRSSFIRLDDYKLSTAAEKFLGEKKLIGDENKGKDIEEAFAKNPQKLVDYNLKDSKLVIDILKKTKVLDLSIQRALLVGLTLDRVKASIASLDSLYLRELKKKGYVAYSTKYDEESTRITGGYVQESKPGIYDYIIVMDFKSLYPSIIRTFNIDPLSFVQSGKGKNLIVAPNKAAFRNEEGILPILIQRLWEQRDKAKNEKDMLKSNAIKILMNSFFGVLANSTCRFFSLKMANAITHFGQHIIKQTAKKVNEMGYEVIYSDTDSIFVKTDAKNEKEAKKVGKEIQSCINKFFVEHVKKEYNRDNFLELEFEKIFKVFMMPKVRGGEAGSKKRYAGLLLKDGKEKMDFTGLEFVRRDWTDLAKNFQLEVLDRIFHKKEITSYVKKYVNDLKKGKFDGMLVYRKALRKATDEYTKTTPPHVKAARMLDKIESNIIQYIVTVDGPQPIQKLKSSIDYDHYLEKQIKPIADSVLVFFDQTFDDILKGDTQKSLFSF